MNSKSSHEQVWSWPDSLDAMNAAPEHHKLLLENEYVRVVCAVISPGSVVPVHTHRWPSVLFVFGWSDVIRRDHLGNEIPPAEQDFRALNPNTPIWQPPLGPHSVENIGNAQVKTVQVEIKAFDGSISVSRLRAFSSLMDRRW